MAVTIKTNNVPRDVVTGAQLNGREKAEFDYYTNDELENASFFRYKGDVYDIGEFLYAPESLEPWHGYFSTTHFSGVVIRYTDDMESVIVGVYWC